MEETKVIDRDPVPYIVHEGILTRQERNIKRLWILCIIIFIALVGTNAGWIWYESQFETYYYLQDGEGINSINTGEGDINYGAEVGLSQEKER